MTDFNFRNYSSSQNAFDEHISSSIPGYDLLFESILDLSDYFVEKNTNVYDIGSSSGKLINALSERHTSTNFIAIETEESFHNNPNYKNIEIIKDVQDCVFDNASFVSSIFTMQFLPIEVRKDTLMNIYDNLIDGGVFIMTEKINLKNSIMNNVLQDILIENKRETFTPDEILNKNVSLRKLMRTLTDEENINLLKNSGFREIEKFWQNNRFVGYICRKEVQ